MDPPSDTATRPPPRMPRPPARRVRTPMSLPRCPSGRCARRCGALLSIVAPTTLVVALLYYFGWARTSAEAHALGLDDSLFGYSTQDYILRSISSMYWPLFVGAGAVLVGLFVHG